jgi:hypothetical protein
MAALMVLTFLLSEFRQPIELFHQRALLLGRASIRITMNKQIFKLLPQFAREAVIDESGYISWGHGYQIE